ncbi:hypothetical protein BDP27DRAFT_1363432 [Rhodocollybia butyracea]|uniref:Uncharacterized protein n=1 Tax=Rhodocollybia butyracea TaxID=206335 RepID=A0A9P5U8U4_9AGAR|nr:hypothetical protein BDP27DRAFT_1363432 [Rhodocollybia butyracea]
MRTTTFPSLLLYAVMVVASALAFPIDRYYDQKISIVCFKPDYQVSTTVTTTNWPDKASDRPNGVTFDVPLSRTGVFTTTLPRNCILKMIMRNLEGDIVRTYTIDKPQAVNAVFKPEPPWLFNQLHVICVELEDIKLPNVH